MIASATAAVINLAIILILNFFYYYLAIFLTSWENHEVSWSRARRTARQKHKLTRHVRISLSQTDSKHERYLTIKIFVFQFVNLYSSLFYIAFIQVKTEAETGRPLLCVWIKMLTVGHL